MPPNKKTAKKAAKKAATKKKSGKSGEALDLIAPKKKAAKKKAAAKKKITGTPPSREKSKIGGKELSEAKADALNLFEEEEKKADRPKVKKAEVKEEKSVFQSLTSGGGEVGSEEAAAAENIEVTEDGQKVIHLKPPIVVKELAELMDLKPFKIIKDLMALDVFVNQNQSIEPEVAAKVCEQHGFVFEREKREKGAGVHKVEEVIEEPEAAVEEVEEDKLVERPPIVTVMGHVDHGKTSLLDAIRNAKVVDGEAGGITQHIAAYSVEHEGKSITFIDTPGHTAFTEMRARGANVTDIVILVIAANDGIMPTTKEAISHAKAAEVEIIVAVNKIDLPNADPNKAKQQLQEYDLAPEEWGGSTICVDVSALKRIGIEDVLEMINLQAEVLELKADPKATARAAVIEARMEPGRGATASVIVQAGTLKVGTPFICGNYWGKIKSMYNDKGEQVKTAGPAMPVEVLGFSDVPAVGDELVQMDNERKAKKLSEERLEEVRQKKLKAPVHSTLEGFMSSIDAGQKKTLKIILKTDVQGSSEAIEGALNEIESDKINLDIILNSPGAISESDVLLASASDAVIIGFNTKQESNAVRAAKREGVQVKLYSIIYELIDQVKEAMLGLLDPETRESNLGYAEVKQVFKLSGGRVAGCLVTKGKILRSGRARVLRDRQPVYDGGVQTLKRFQDDANEVKNGLECGIRLGNFNDYEEGDIIECYE
ncbi:MAG: translation initiation factor IF-2, partial [Verrucomicrobiota bacterium]